MSDSEASSISEAVLTIVKGPNTGMRFVLNREITEIGRNNLLDIFLEDPAASRWHAEIIRSGREFVIRDRGSSNGVRRNGELVTEATLVTGDRIQIGGTLLVFEGSDDRPAT